MVRIRIIARVIPEDVWIRDIESSIPSPATSSLVGEKRLMQLVHDPQNVSIGMLANEIKATFHNINHVHLGDIKYLKDGEVDADLDPGMSVYDAFVDAGKAATSLEDQRATIKIIREIKGQHFAVREGSVVPDLSNPRFQPRMLPPVPRFSDTPQNLGKRSRDNAFREDDSDREEAYNLKSVRIARHDGVEESEAAGRLVPSIERDLQKPSQKASRRRWESPIVIPETQESPHRNGISHQQGGSEILGDEEPKSESPEVEDSIHSLPMAEKHLNDTEFIETVPLTENVVASRSSGLDHFQAQTAAAPGQEPASLSSSNYYSPTSGSLHSVSNGTRFKDRPASGSAEVVDVINRANPTTSFTRTKLSLAKEVSVQNGPITPPSDASRPCNSKAPAQEVTNTMSNEPVPQSRTSSFTYKFRREDRVHSAESEIDDTQMSPRSRKSLQQRRKVRHQEAAPKSVTVRELSGLFDHMDERRPLIQEHKRKRNETKWDFIEHIDGSCEAESEKASSDEDECQDEAQQSTADSFSSDNDEAEDNAEQRSKSHALSDATNKDSNASTERPTVSTSMNALRLSRPPQEQALRRERVSDIRGEGDSDKENAHRQQAMYPQPPSLNWRQDVDAGIRESVNPHKKENANGINGSDTRRQSDDHEIEILRDDIAAQGDSSKRLNGPNDQRFRHDVSGQLQSSATLRDNASPKMSRPRKKKSRVETEEETPKSDAQQPDAHSALKFVTGNASSKSSHENLSSMAKSKVENRVISHTEPDEQLSQDLQASAQASSKKITPIAKSGKAEAHKHIASLKNVAGTGNVESAESARKSFRNAKTMEQCSHLNNGQPPESAGSAKNKASFIRNEQAVAIASDPQEGSARQEKTKDGKLGLGFSQSPPRKSKAMLLSDVNHGQLDHEVHSANLESLPETKDEHSFLKKSKSFEKLKSSQSWGAETPSRSMQPAKQSESTLQQTNTDVPRQKFGTVNSRDKPKSIPSVHTGSSGSDSEFESGSDEDSSASVGAEASKAVQTGVKNGNKTVLADAPVPSIEIISDSASSESNAVLPPSKTAIKVTKPHKDGPTIVPKGNNVYNVNGTTVIVPLGFTVHEYLAMRTDLANQPPKSNPRNRKSNFGKSATPTLHQKGSSATPVPALAKVPPKKAVPKNNDKQQENATKGEDSPQPSTAQPTAKTGEKGITKLSKMKESTRPMPTVATEKARAAGGPTASKPQPTTKASVPAKTRTVASTSTNSNPVAQPSSKPIAPSKPMLPKKPLTINELKAQREAERAAKTAASSLKTSGMTTPNLANGRNFMEGGESESESESETESETTDEGVVASKSKPTQARTPVVVDLSIRDPSPSSAEDESD